MSKKGSDHPEEYAYGYQVKSSNGFSSQKGGGRRII